LGKMHKKNCMKQKEMAPQDHLFFFLLAL
jgi:hypothetical protein